MNIITWLSGEDAIPEVGGKGASLAKMVNLGLPVPNCFAVTSDAFKLFLDQTGIKKELYEALKVDVDDPDELKEAEKAAKELILSKNIPPEISEPVASAYDEICGDEEKFVAVRSSATAEDLPDASFAGQQDTFLNIKSKSAVVDAVKKCWASLYNSRAIFYREKQGFDHEDVSISVVVQEMVDADKAGVMFTRDPASGEDNVVIESSWGLGEIVVSGKVSPDRFVVVDDKIADKVISTKNVMHVRENSETVEKDVPADMREIASLSDDEVLELSKLGKKVEEHYGDPQDIEWVIKDGNIYFVQSRSITTLRYKEGETILKGLGASPGTAFGRVKVIHDLSMLDKVQAGDVLVTTMTNPDMAPAMKKSSAIITNEGGLTCHAAIVSRELGIPSVVGTKEATRKLSDGMDVTVDGTRGEVISGIKEEKPEVTREVVARGEAPITATEVKVNISIPEVAERAVNTGADGVGLLRIEHMILETGKHPQKYIKGGDEESYVDLLVDGIKRVAEEFYPKSVWVRTLDAPTDEFKSLEGGEGEPIETNPMLGFRGIRRDLGEKEHFKLELRAIRKLIEMGYKNIGIMLPMVQSASELRDAKQLISEELELDEIEFGVMIETPASALIIEDLIEEGIDFISFGTNDLTQYTLAIDRNNENVAHLFNEKHPAVLKLIGHVIKKCNEAGVETSICGQAGSDPEMAEILVKFGIFSLSANTDAVEEVRETVARAERRLILESLRKRNDERAL